MAEDTKPGSDTPIDPEILARSREPWDAIPGPDAPIEEIEAYLLKDLWDDEDGDDEPTTKGGGIARLASPPVDPRLVQAQADATGSVMLELQQECIQLRRDLEDARYQGAIWNRRAVTLREVLEQQGSKVAWTDDGLYMEPKTRGEQADG